jgi:hypothetical protein
MEGLQLGPHPSPLPKGEGVKSTRFMNIDSIKTISGRVIAFAGTAAFSLAIMNSLPRVREQRQRSFAQATMDGRLYRMRWLHFAGANLNARGSSGVPLFVAAGEGNLEVVRYLLDEGADVTHTTIPAPPPWPKRPTAGTSVWLKNCCCAEPISIALVKVARRWIWPSIETTPQLPTY